MKRKLTLLAALLTCQLAQAQIEWKLSGNTVTTDSRLGTNNGYDMIFETANLERMRLSDAGYFGIGVINPLAALHVAGEFRMDGNIRLGDFVDAAAEPFRYTYVDNEGILKAGPIENLLAALTVADCSLLPGGLFPAPFWASQAGEQYGIIYTGFSCHARVGIGTNTPRSRLDVSGGIFANSILIGNPSYNGSLGRLTVTSNSDNSNQTYLNITNSGNTVFTAWENTDAPFTIRNGLAAKDYLHLHPSGAIDFNFFGAELGGIALALRKVDPQTHEVTDIANLTTDGKWWCQGVVVKHVPFWGDFVFDKEYDLKPLSLVEQYITVNHHLPDLPSAQEVSENGIAVEEMIRLLTIKVEELTLHAIAQKKEIETLKAQMNEYKVEPAKN